MEGGSKMYAEFLGFPFDKAKIGEFIREQGYCADDSKGIGDGDDHIIIWRFPDDPARWLVFIFRSYKKGYRFEFICDQNSHEMLKTIQDFLAQHNIQCVMTE